MESPKPESQAVTCLDFEPAVADRFKALQAKLKAVQDEINSAFGVYLAAKGIDPDDVIVADLNKGQLVVKSSPVVQTLNEQAE